MNTFKNFELKELVEDYRARLEKHFSPDTSLYDADHYNGGSHGHCAAVAYLVQGKFGGKLMSTVVKGFSHWFNRIECDNGWHDIDITADQFGDVKVKMTYIGHLYLWSVERSVMELDSGTKSRAILLAKRTFS